MKSLKLLVDRYIYRLILLSLWLIVAGPVLAQSTNQSNTQKQSEFTAPPPVMPGMVPGGKGDSTQVRFPVRPTLPLTADEAFAGRGAVDLKDPQNITTTAEYDFRTGTYVLRTRVGDRVMVTPIVLSAEEYNRLTLKHQMQAYYNKRNSEMLQADKQKDPFNFLDMKFGLGPLESVFGPGGIQLKTQGSLKVNMGVKSNKTDNPALALGSRRKTYFDFDQKIQATIQASVGDKMRFNMSYNTDATFDFDNKNLKLAYEGKEDEIIKLIEAGNVSMTTGSSLIRGSAALFGIKTKLQFGKLTATALISQQNSQSQTVNTKGGAQTTPFTITADSYDQNRHFFLSQFFREHYDQWSATLPLVSSGINITRLEVWITNKRGNYDNSRNLLAFADVGESNVLTNSHWLGGTAEEAPSNTANNLLNEIKTNYPDARNINSVATTLAPLESYGIEGGKDYEKVESARLLTSSEYTLNSSLGYISLKTTLNADEVLAVAYEYTYGGKTYRVGEFASDITSSDQNLYVKMLKGTTVSTSVPVWKLMMKNVYSIGAYQMQKSNFKLNIKYLSDTTGTQLNYIPAGNINGVPLLQVMNLDRLDANNENHRDGRFDYLEGYTVLSSQGKVIFPVVEPFGSHLRKAINNDAVAAKYVYQQLYDSTLTVARQYQELNKFIIEGEYQGAGGNQIRLNAMNVPRGSVVVTAGGVTLVENSDYTVDYNMGIVTITNQSIIDAGTNISVQLENQSMFSTQRKTLMGLDLDYAFNKNFHWGATVMHYGEKALTEKVSIGDELVNNTIWGTNVSYKTDFMWLTNLLNKIPTINATAPSSLTFQGEFAQLVPHTAKSGSNKGSSYIDDFESTQSGIDLRSPFSWFLASTPYDGSSSALFPEASLSNHVDYGKNRALLSWYYIDRLFTQRNSSFVPGYIKNDLNQLSNPYIREIPYSEVFPGRQLNYGESSIIQTLNLSYYPTERGPYNLDATNVDERGHLLFPERRWGGIMRRLDNTNFEQSNVEYIQFWMLDPFLDPDNPNTEGGDLYLNLGEVSEDILKDGLKSYENGLPTTDDDSKVTSTVWGKVSKQNSVTYAFDNTSGSRKRQDAGLNGLTSEEEKTFPTYKDYVDQLRTKLSPTTISEMEGDKLSPLNDPAGDNYHFYRGYDYDELKLGILDRYKHYNGTEGNSLSPDEADDALYQSARAVPDVEDINQDNTLNEYERYFQYRISIRPEDLQVGRNFITDKQETTTTTRNGKQLHVVWYQFTIPLRQYEKIVGSIKDFSTIRFMRMYLTKFRAPTHLRFATLELIRGEWRNYDYNLNMRGDQPSNGSIQVNTVNIEENAGREPVNYVLPPGVSRIVDSGQSQITQLNEQSMQMKVEGLQAGDARAVYRNTTLDLRTYRRLQMFLHNEAFINDATNLRDGDVSAFVRLGTDAKNNYYEYEIPLRVTPAGRYNTNSSSDRLIVWPEQNMLDCNLNVFPLVKRNRNQQKIQGVPGVGFGLRFTEQDPDHPNNRVTVVGNPTLSDVRVMMIGVRNNSSSTKDFTVWADELRLTDFDQSGGWAAKANLNLAMSDLATVNVGWHKETYGFGSVNQSLNNRRKDNYDQYNVAFQMDAGRLVPEKVKLKAPVYYSYSREVTTPKYNPLDQDMLLKDALDATVDDHQRDSIQNFAVTNRTTESFSVSGLKFDIKSKNPMPWDPANFTFSYSFNKQHVNDPQIEFENTRDFRGSFMYSWTPFVKPFKPFDKMIKSKNANLKFFKDWELRYLPSNISLHNNISRYYYEQQTRNQTDISIDIPVSVSKNFLWDRQFSISWDFTKSLSLQFNNNTQAHILEPVGEVNKRLFPDQYRDWRDTVMRSIRDLGTPWAYSQNLSLSYRLPFNYIPVLSWITGNASYNGTYNWDRGAVINNISSGNTIANQSTLNMDGRLNFEQLYNKIPFLKEVNNRFSNAQRQKVQTNIKRFNRNYKLNADTTLMVKHNMNVKKVRVSATYVNGQRFPVKYEIKDNNTVEILNKGKDDIRLTITEVREQKTGFFRDLAQYSARFAMMVRSASVRYRNTRSLSLPQFTPEIGDWFGQAGGYDVLAPGLDFAFGLTDESYIDKAKQRGWLLNDASMTTPALFANTREFNAELQLEPVKGLKVTLTGNHTDNRTNQVQFMYDQPTTIFAGSYTRTHVALASAFHRSSAKDGYYSAAFARFLDNIPIVAQRLEQRYAGVQYPDRGFINGSVYAGKTYDAANGGVNTAGSDVLIPAFLAAYSGGKAGSTTLDLFPGLSSMLPNWRVTYDGLSKMPLLQKLFKNFTLTHAYQCTYNIGSFTSYTDWVSVQGQTMGFTQDGVSGKPVPTSPYNVGSAVISERFAPLIGVNATLHNGMTFNLEYRDSRTLSLNTSALQLVETSTAGLVIGAGYKIANFNSVLKIKKKQQAVSNDLTLNLDFTLNNNTALIRKIDLNTAQATSGTRSLAIHFTANYVMSRKVTLGAYFDHEVNTPLVSDKSYPTTNSNFGISLNVSLAK